MKQDCKGQVSVLSCPWTL